jgi:hypothetical protein
VARCGVVERDAATVVGGGVYENAPSALLTRLVRSRQRAPGQASTRGGRRGARGRRERGRTEPAQSFSMRPRASSFLSPTRCP